MKYIFFTFDGQGLPIAFNLQNEGHSVIVGQVQDKADILSKVERESEDEDEVTKQRRLSLYDNMLEKVPAWELIEKMKMITDPQEYFVFFDFNTLFKFADEVKKMGFQGNFPTEEDHLFEINRDAAKEFVKKYYPRLNIPNVKEFSKVKDAIQFLKESNDIWVIKGKDESVKTYVPDTDDVELAREQDLNTLETFKEDLEKVGFILEEMIPSVIELTPEKFYYNGVPLATTINIENKYFGSGNISIQTGCASDLVFPTNLTDRINQIAFPPIVDELARKHHGWFIWDASILINKKGGKMYFGEFCSNRPGYNSLFTEIAQTGSVNRFFTNIVNKFNPFTIGTVATSMRIFNLHRDPDDYYVLDNVTIDYKPEIQKDLWLFDAKKPDGRIVNTGVDWNLGVITGFGRSINEAIDKMYENIDNFSFFGAYYRPKDDFLSLDYPTSILNRLNYGLDRNLYTLPFNVRVGEIK